MSTLRTTNIQHPDADEPNIVLAADGGVTAAGLVTGKVLQVVSVTKVDTFSTSSASFVDITGLTVNITPSATSSKILVLYKVSVCASAVGVAMYLQMLRGATVIGGGTAAGSRGSAMSTFYDGTQAGATNDLNGNFLDSPASVAEQTYKLQTKASSGAAQINITNNDTDAFDFARLSSTITVMEIGA